MSGSAGDATGDTSAATGAAGDTGFVTDDRDALG